LAIILLLSLVKSDLSSDWKAVILNGITTLPKLGYPGKVMVYGPKSIPMVVGENADDILIAAA